MTYILESPDRCSDWRHDAVDQLQLKNGLLKAKIQGGKLAIGSGRGAIRMANGAHNQIPNSYARSAHNMVFAN
jgi:hypothetical protein